MKNLLEQLKRHEGFKGVPYKCSAGKTTIGYGRNLEANPLTETEAEALLINDINAINFALVYQLNFTLISPVRQAVLSNMAFNLGVNGLLKFKNMLAAANSGDYELAAKEMLDSKWARQVGNRAIELSEQMRTGEWS